jgi:hypothetical protein
MREGEGGGGGGKEEGRKGNLSGHATDLHVVPTDAFVRVLGGPCVCVLCVLCLSRRVRGLVSVITSSKSLLLCLPFVSASKPIPHKLHHHQHNTGTFTKSLHRASLSWRGGKPRRLPFRLFAVMHASPKTDFYEFFFVCSCPGPASMPHHVRRQTLTTPAHTRHCCRQPRCMAQWP